MIGNEAYRDYMKIYGIRLLVDVTGEGKTLSLAAFIMQISSALALLTIAITITDIIMLHFPWLKHRKLYFRYKIEDSEDFSNL
jgi:hypothetical protein